MKKLILCTIIALSACVATHAQTSPCPQGLVCISEAAARKALQDSDTVEAQRKEIETLRQAVIDQRFVTADVKIELAKAMGEKTQLEIANLRLDGNLTVCMKKRAVKVGIFNIN
jgi:glycine cleavage system pyridoxal-binding protein P